MPSYVIHIAIAKEYIRKHKNEIKDEDSFIKGNIYPDNTNNKYISHYGNYAERHVGLSNFLNQNDIDINTDYGKGYFMHLLADEIFYHKFFEKELKCVEESNLKTLHHDYYCLNKYLLKEYKITNLPEEVKKFSKELNEDPEFIDIKRVKKFIDRISEISIKKQIEKISITGEPII